MEQMTLFTGQNWKDVINDILSMIIVDEELPEKSLVLAENYSDKKDKITSYSISVKKPDYPRGINSNGNAKNTIFNIQPKVNKKDEVEELTFCLPDEMVPLIEQKSFDISVKKRKSEVYSRVLISPESNDFKEFSLYVVKSSLDIFFAKGGTAFGCCSRYEKCSDARKCLHENRLYALGCAYYHSLRAGRIFYGKNRNI